MKLLIVEDNDALREQMKWALTDEYSILEADSSQSCLEVVDQHEPLLITLDMGLDNQPDKGLLLIDEMLKKNRLIKIVVITANTDAALGPEAIAKGAFDFLKKPVDIDELKIILNRACRILGLEKNDETLKVDSLQSSQDFKMVGECDAMQKIFDLVKRLSKTEVNVLITGDSGTGKEVCARSIHFHSNRANESFVPINCGAIPENLIESELFGYVKGAFTGANTDKIGLIESANGGTLFLDEIGDMPMHLQVKLLRFIEDQRFQRVGDATMHQADVRIIAATNKKDLSVEDNEVMRTDLYYRLSEFEIHLPPLKERGNDIIHLAKRIVERNREKFSMPKLKLSSRAEQLLLHYDWPGNVRELENKLSRSAITCVNQIIEPEDLQISAGSLTRMSFKDARSLFEKNYITNALRHAEYVISDAAKNMGVTRPTLYDLMKKHNVIIKTEAKIQ